MTARPLPPPLRRSPLQQWTFVHHPGSDHDELRQRYGEIAHFAFQGKHFALVLTPDGVREVFSAPPAGYDAFWKESFEGLNGRGSLWAMAGEKHRRERLLFAPAVHACQFRPQGGTIRDIVRRHLDGWRPGLQLKAEDAMLPIARDVILRLVFGVLDQALIDEGSDTLDRHTRSIHPLIVFFPKLQRRWFPLWRRYARLTAEMHAWMDKVIARRRADVDDGRVDVLERLLQARDEEGRPYADEHVRNELVSILGAGYKTTAVSLAWAMYELSLHAGPLAKLRAELDSSAAGDPVERLSLPYLSAVVKETIRLHPILAECARVPIEPIEIRGYAIPAGCALVVPIAGIHHDPELYPEPQRFRPERFLEREYGKYEFLPFGGAHRRCLGEGLAEYVMRIALAEIVLGWEFEATAPDSDKRHDISMGSRHGVPMRINARRRPATGASPAERREEMVHA